MFSGRGRYGPSKSTPASVQCQKCLKKGHYSYECKAAPQERPYVPRPSRTQQLLNPKLQPKLTNETPDAVETKKGLADEVLAKREAERARKRALEDDAETSPREGSPRRRRSRSRSYSSDSASSISTRSPSPARERPASRCDSPPPQRTRYRESRDRSPSPVRGRHPSVDSRERHSDRPSESRDRGYSSRGSPSRSPSPRPPRRDASSERDRGYGKAPQPRRDYSRSQSPPRPAARRDPGVSQYRDREDRREDRHPPQRPPPQERRPSPPRQRSLSPFSKRLALTQSMNLGR